MMIARWSRAGYGSEFHEYIKEFRYVLEGYKYKYGADVHGLYRVYTTWGDLLYVGITKNPVARFLLHRKQSPWLSEAVQMTWEIWPSRAEVLIEELRVIQTENPIYNKKGKN